MATAQPFPRAYFPSSHSQYSNYLMHPNVTPQQQMPVYSNSHSYGHASHSQNHAAFHAQSAMSWLMSSDAAKTALLSLSSASSQLPLPFHSPPMSTSLKTEAQAEQFYPPQQLYLQSGHPPAEVQYSTYGSTSGSELVEEAEQSINRNYSCQNGIDSGARKNSILVPSTSSPAPRLSPSTTNEIMQQFKGAANNSTFLSAPSSASSASSSSSVTPREMDEYLAADTIEAYPASPFSVQASSASHSAASQWGPSPMSTSDSSESPSEESLMSRVKKPTLRKKREAFRYDKETRRVKRLENHRRYDRKRKMALDTVFLELRAVIQSTVKITKSCKVLLSEDAAQAGSRTESCVHASASVKEEDGMEAETLQALSDRDLENLSQYELFSTAADAIRSLNATKAKLEKLVEEDEQPQSQEAPHTAAVQAVGAHSSGDISLALDLSSLPLDEQHQAKQLLAAIRFAQASYMDQCTKYRSLTERIPNVVLDSTDALPPHCVFALNGVNLVTVLQPHIMKRFLGEDVLGNCWHSDVLCNSHRAQVLQHFTICSLLSSSMVQSMAREAATKGSAVKVEEDQKHFQEICSDLPTYVRQSIQACTKDFSRMTPTALSAAAPHPLQSLSISKELVSIVREITVWLASLDAHEYQEQYEKLRQYARDIAEQNQLDVQYKMPSLPRITANDSDRSPIDYMFNSYFQFDHQQMKGLADLLTGKDKFVSFTKYAVISPTDKCLYLDCDASLLIHPDTGEPLGVFGFVRRMYWGERFVPNPSKAARQLNADTAGASAHPHLKKHERPHTPVDSSSSFALSSVPPGHASSNSVSSGVIPLSDSILTAERSSSSISASSSSSSDAEIEFGAPQILTRSDLSSTSSGSDSDSFLDSDSPPDASTILQHACFGAGGLTLSDAHAAMNCSAVVTPPVLYSTISSAINSAYANSDFRVLPSMY